MQSTKVTRKLSSYKEIRRRCEAFPLRKYPCPVWLLMLIILALRKFREITMVGEQTGLHSKFQNSLAKIQSKTISQKPPSIKKKESLSL